MLYTFGWVLSKNDIAPTCRVSGREGRENFDSFCCLLTDDGGHGYAVLIPAADDAIARIGNVTDLELPGADWASDSWAADIAIDGVAAFSLHDERFRDHLTLKQFSELVGNWKAFLECGPRDGEVVGLGVVS